MHGPPPKTQEVPLLGSKAIGLLAVVGITGLTGAIGVLVTQPSSTTEVVAPRAAPPKPRPRPHLRNPDDVRTLPLHRAHLEASQRVECADCHDLRANDFRAPPVATCKRCHDDHEPTVHKASPDAAACLSCHDFLAPGPASWANTCETCHADAKGTHPAIAIHAKQDCAQCHTVHARKPPPDCLKCHDKQATSHRAGGEYPAACLSCHPPHTPAKLAAERCVRCHVEDASGLPAAVRIPPSALFAGHDRCVQCHAGHAFSRDSVRACRDCHQSKHVSTAHQACTSCHDPHAARTLPTSEKCGGCHRAKPVLASAKVAAHACTNCHDPHQQPAAPAARCATCHREVADHLEHKGGSCTACHPPHAQMATTRVALGCTDKCHAENRRHGTAACNDCHKRHDFAPPKQTQAFCLGCHAKPQGRAPVIATSDGHAQCTRCHQQAAHMPSAPRPACASCHGAEASTAPAGHADCKRCHDVHSGKRIATCDSCHADRTQTPHVRVPGGCQSCHRPHGPNGVAVKPACTTCHSKLPGLHGKHQTCTDCHRAHATAVTDRDRCVRCHVDKRDHVPDAQRCQACHIFGGAK